MGGNNCAKRHDSDLGIIISIVLDLLIKEINCTSIDVKVWFHIFTVIPSNPHRAHYTNVTFTWYYPVPVCLSAQMSRHGIYSWHNSGRAWSSSYSPTRPFVFIIIYSTVAFYRLTYYISRFVLANEPWTPTPLVHRLFSNKLFLFILRRKISINRNEPRSTAIYTCILFRAVLFKCMLPAYCSNAWPESWLRVNMMLYG